MSEPSVAFRVLLIYGGLFALGAALIAAGNWTRHVDRAGRRTMWVKYATYLVVTGSLLVSAFLHPIVFSLLVILILSVSTFELLALTGGLVTWGCLLGALVPLAGIRGEGSFYLAFSVAIVALLLVPLFSSDSDRALDATAQNLRALCYIGLLGGHAILLAGHDNFFGHVVFFYMLVLVNDAMALLWGRLLGKRKIWPVLSPNKTYGGSVAALLWTLLTGYLMRFAEPEWSLIEVLAASAAISVFGQLGDVVASAFKRRAGVKDFGTLLPTFGGMLDRFDAFIFTAPVFYLFVKWTSSS